MQRGCRSGGHPPKGTTPSEFWCQKTRPKERGFCGTAVVFAAQCCERWANAGKTVIVAALDGTFQRKAFNRILELIPLAEEVTKLNAVCSFCQNDAAFTTRLGDETELEVIGGAEKYVATCRSCFNRVNAPACPVVRTGPRGGKKVAAPGVAALSLSDGDMHTSP